ncbi:jupiter microtubule associated homolog 1-like [Protopterus annectens]|uniref:jupiter microtubule associated homolog 1-like n=1 Tax=Protopterus annectens TaxID=7888 RepID=UPI001CFBC14B|nr:jupiter microtubule associated homolog 1-like [Protopterus annectens]
MTTTRCFQGLVEEPKTGSRVLQPPGGGSSFSFGMGEDSKPQPSRQKRTDSDIFGPPVDSHPAARRSNPPGGRSTIFSESESLTSPKRNFPGGKNCGELKDGVPEKWKGSRFS